MERDLDSWVLEDVMQGTAVFGRDLVDDGVARGLRHEWLETLRLRVEAQSAKALALARWLEAHPGVERVNYPGLESHPQHALARRQMQHFGTVLAFDVKGGAEAVNMLFEKVQLLRVATSLGGPETLVCHPATTTHASLTPEEAVEQGVTPGLVRMSVGLEDTADLIADLSAAL